MTAKSYGYGSFPELSRYCAPSEPATAVNGPTLNVRFSACALPSRDVPRRRHWVMNTSEVDADRPCNKPCITTTPIRTVLGRGRSSVTITDANSEAVIALAQTTTSRSLRRGTSHEK